MKNSPNQFTILLIESDSDWRADVYSLLRDAGCDVLIAKGGDAGFCAARRVRPDLILCEAALPDISGVQLCYMIRADKNLHDALFILMGDADNQNCDLAAEAFRAGADDYFEKNGSRHFFLTRIARLIALRRAESELRQRYRNLYRSELRLTKIVEDTFNLIAFLEPAFKLTASNKIDSPKSKLFNQRSRTRKRLSGKNVNASEESWKRAFQQQEFVETNKFGNRKREKVYYEVV